jgi:hypothetical protein
MERVLCVLDALKKSRIFANRDESLHYSLIILPNVIVDSNGFHDLCLLTLGARTAGVRQGKV